MLNNYRERLLVVSCHDVDLQFRPSLIALRGQWLWRVLAPFAWATILALLLVRKMASWRSQQTVGQGLFEDDLRKIRDKTFIKHLAPNFCVKRAKSRNPEGLAAPHFGHRRVGECSAIGCHCGSLVWTGGAGCFYVASRFAAA